MKGCRLILVGIANSIDLTQRVLPRLQTLVRKPHLVTFPSYSASQLETLLHQRLASLPGPVFHPQAIRLVAKKVGLLLAPQAQLGTLHCVGERCGWSQACVLQVSFQLPDVYEGLVTTFLSCNCLVICQSLMRKWGTDSQGCAGAQTASRSGDMRQVLDACAAAVDVAVQQAAEEGASAEPGAHANS